MEPLKIFIAFAPEDKAEKDKLRKFLVPMSRVRNIELWDESKIDPGQPVEATIEGRLMGADIVLLLLSIESLDNAFFYDRIVRSSLVRNERKECMVIPIILNHCGWRDTPLGKLKPLPENGAPVVDWKPETLAFQEIANGVNSVIDKLESQRNFEKLIHQGRQAFEKSLFLDAQKAFNEAIFFYQAEFEPSDAEIIGLIGQCNEALKKEAEAEDMKLRQTEFSKLVKQAQQMASTGNWGEAKGHYQAALRLFSPGFLPDESEIRSQIALCNQELLNAQRHQNQKAPEPLHAPFVKQLKALFAAMSRKEYALLCLATLALATTSYWYFNKPDDPKTDPSLVLPEMYIPELRKFMKEYPKGPLRGTAKIKMQLLEIEYNRTIDDAKTLQKYSMADSACALVKYAYNMDPERAATNKLIQTMRCDTLGWWRNAASPSQKEKK
jgi:TIR domain